MANRFLSLHTATIAGNSDPVLQAVPAAPIKRSAHGDAWIPENIVFKNKSIFDKLDAAFRMAIIELACASEVHGPNRRASGDCMAGLPLAGDAIDASTMDSFLRRYLGRSRETLARDWLMQVR